MQYFQHGLIISNKAPYKAEEKVKEMQSLQHMIPNLITFNTAMDAWTTKSNNDIYSAKRCELLLRYMEDMHKLTNDDNDKPDVFSYNAVINAYAKSKKKGISA